MLSCFTKELLYHYQRGFIMDGVVKWSLKVRSKVFLNNIKSEGLTYCKIFLELNEQKYENNNFTQQILFVLFYYLLHYRSVQAYSIIYYTIDLFKHILLFITLQICSSIQNITGRIPFTVDILTSKVSESRYTDAIKSTQT